MAVNYTQTYKTYEDADAAARRAQALADALQQQAYRPIEMTAAAPVSYTEGLAKVLQAYMAGRQQTKAAEAAKEAKRVGRQEFKDYLESLSPEQQTVNAGQLAQMEMPTPMLEDGRISYKPAAPVVNQQAMPQMTAAGTPDFSLPMKIQTGGPLTPAQRRAKLLEGMGSGNPMVQTIAQMEYAKKPEVEEFYQPTETATGQLVQFGKHGGKRDTGLMAAPKAETTPNAVREYQYAVNQGYQGKFQDFMNERARSGASTTTVSYGAPVAGVDEKGNQVFFQPAKGGGAPSIVKGVRPAPEGMKEGQAKEAGFADRIAQSTPFFDTAEPPTVSQGIKSNVPLAGNAMLTPESRQWYQNERNFINAVLRRESGATIQPHEFAEARQQYIPQPFDDPGTKEMKRRNRETVMRAVARGAGPTYKLPSVGDTQWTNENEAEYQRLKAKANQ